MHTYRGPSSVGQSWWESLCYKLAHHSFIPLDASTVEGQKDAPLDQVFSELPDLLFLYWRWPFPEGTRKQEAYLRQQELLDFALGARIPVLILDGDLQPGVLDVADNLRRYDLKVVVAAPMLYPRAGYRQLFYPVSYVWPMPIAFPFQFKKYDFAYVGNDYRRYEQMQWYLNNPTHAGMDMRIWGNWLDYNEEAKLKKDFPYVKFMGRLPQDQILDILGPAYFTYHFAPPEYCDCGFVTMRWQQAASSGTVAILPNEFKASATIRKLFSYQPEDFYSDGNLYRSIVNQQFSAISSLSDFTQWKSLIHEMLGTK